MPMIARTNSLPERARPNAATAPNSGIKIADSGPEILCQSTPFSASTGRPAASRSSIADLSLRKGNSSPSTCASVNWSGRTFFAATIVPSGSTVPERRMKRRAFVSSQPPPATARALSADSIDDSTPPVRS